MKEGSFNRAVIQRAILTRSLVQTYTDWKESGRKHEFVGTELARAGKKRSRQADGLSTLSLSLLSPLFPSAVLHPEAKNKVRKVTAKCKQHETRVKILALRRMLPL